MNKTKTIFITDFVVALILLIIFGRFSYFFVVATIILVIFNILTGIIIFFVRDQELGIAFVFVGVVGALIGGSFCGLQSIVR
jgi:hypothetical protein